MSEGPHEREYVQQKMAEGPTSPAVPEGRRLGHGDLTLVLFHCLVNDGNLDDSLEKIAVCSVVQWKWSN